MPIRRRSPSRPPFSDKPGAVAYLHGSGAASMQHPRSDIDTAAYFGNRAPQSFEILMPPKYA
jgi:hypothetical protein